MFILSFFLFFLSYQFNFFLFLSSLYIPPLNALFHLYLFSHSLLHLLVPFTTSPLVYALCSGTCQEPLFTSLSFNILPLFVTLKLCSFSPQEPKRVLHFSDSWILAETPCEMDAMRREDFFDEIMNHSDYNEEKPSLEKKWNSTSSGALDSDDSPSSGFDCNICLDSVQDPVVTLCGHLYCWPCIYKWLHFQSISRENQYQKPPQQCPVCKSEVSQATIVPLFGRGQSSKPSSTKGKAPNLGIIVPQRPLGLAYGFDSPRSNSTSSPLPASQYYHQDYPQSQLYYSQQGRYSPSPAISPGGTSTANLVDPLIGMIREIFYARLFSSSITDIYTYNNSYHLAGSTSPRLRRHVMEADKSLSRICFFLFCCVFLCFLSF